MARTKCVTMFMLYVRIIIVCIMCGSAWPYPKYLGQSIGSLGGKVLFMQYEGQPGHPHSSKYFGPFDHRCKVVNLERLGSFDRRCKVVNHGAKKSGFWKLPFVSTS
jgi:hypothetical protein